MRLTQRERDIVELLRAEPLLDAAALAERIGSTKAAVSVHLSNLTKKGALLGRGYVVRPEAQSVVVVGGVNMDIKAHSRGAVQLRTSNPGTARTSPGGVGRNIAENLARLGSPTHLVAAIGRDAFGEQVTAMTRAAGVMVDHLVVGDDPTGPTWPSWTPTGSCSSRSPTWLLPRASPSPSWAPDATWSPVPTCWSSTATSRRTSARGCSTSPRPPGCRWSWTP